MQRITHIGVMLSMQAEEVMPKGSILHFDKDLINYMVIQWFNIIFLTIVLAYVLYKPVKKFMNDRAQRIKNDIDAAKLANEEALEMKEQYEGLIKNIEREREQVLHHAHKLAMERSDHLLLNARQEADYVLSKAISEIQLERENMAEDIKQQIIELSVMMASRFVEVSIDRQTQERYIDEALGEWGETP